MLSFSSAVYKPHFLGPAPIVAKKIEIVKAAAKLASDSEPLLYRNFVFSMKKCLKLG